MLTLPTKRGLGRGLSSLIPGSPTSGAIDQTDRVLQIDPDDIFANPYQPRTAFEENQLNELAESIRTHGILSPLIVTILPDGSYQLIAGERRLRAARLLGLKTVPVIVRDVKEMERLELALVENIQRADLNPIELAQAYRRLLDECNLTQEALAKRLSRSRPQVTNTLRFLTLPPALQESLAKGEISEGHAKVILSIEGEEGKMQLWRKITLNNLSVRATESEAREIKVSGHVCRATHRDAKLVVLEQKLEERFGTKVRIHGGLDKGTIVIEYYSEEQLRQIGQGDSLANPDKIL